MNISPKITVDFTPNSNSYKLKSQKGLNRILSTSTNKNFAGQQNSYFLKRSLQFKKCQERLEASAKVLKKIEDSSSESDDHHHNTQSMAQTLYQRFNLNRKAKYSLARDYQSKCGRLNLQRTSSERNKYSISTQRRSQRKTATPESKKHDSNKKPLPNLLGKVKKHKQPINASRNNKCNVDEQEKQQEKQPTYDQIKLQRRRLEQIRRLMVLGKVMGENHRRQVRNLFLLKRQNKSLKYAKK